MISGISTSQTKVLLTEDQRAWVVRQSRAAGVSEAAIIRACIERAIGETEGRAAALVEIRSER